jgi:hypothetical protein
MRSTASTLFPIRRPVRERMVCRQRGWHTRFPIAEPVHDGSEEKHEITLVLNWAAKTKLLWAPDSIGLPNAA